MDVDIQLVRGKQLADQVAEQVEQLIVDGMPREEAWDVVTAEVDKALQKLQLVAAEMRRSKM